MQLKRIIPLALAGLALSGGLAACESSADKVSTNLSIEAEEFRVQRHIVGINGITDKLIFDVQGRCSLEFPHRRLEVVCKHGPKDYRKHHIGLADNVSYVNVQTEGIDVSQYRTKIIIKPENILPDFDLVTGETP